MTAALILAALLLGALTYPDVGLLNDFFHMDRICFIVIRYVIF